MAITARIPTADAYRHVHATAMHPPHQHKPKRQHSKSYLVRAGFRQSWMPPWMHLRTHSLPVCPAGAAGCSLLPAHRQYASGSSEGGKGCHPAGAGGCTRDAGHHCQPPSGQCGGVLCGGIHGGYYQCDPTATSTSSCQLASTFALGGVGSCKTCVEQWTHTEPSEAPAMQAPQRKGTRGWRQQTLVLIRTNNNQLVTGSYP